MAKPSNGANRVMPKEIRSSRPYELVTLDLAQFPRSRKGNIYLFLGVDHFSKRAVGKPIKDKTPMTICEEFEYTFLPSFITVPERVLSDNGGEFQNARFANLLEKYQIKHHTIAPGYPASNGAVERLLGTIKNLLRAACMRGGEWDEQWPLTLNAYNNTKHQALTGKPSEVFLANAARVVMPTQSGNLAEGLPHRPYSEGDRVLKKVDQPVSKASPRYEPGFVIIRVNPASRTYVIRRIDPGPGQLTLLKAHHNQLKFECSGPIGLSVARGKERVASAVATLNKLGQATCKTDWAPSTYRSSSQGVGGQAEASQGAEALPSHQSVQGETVRTDLIEVASQPAANQDQESNEGGAVRRSVRRRGRPKYLNYYEW